jgi:hypothetical protein
MPRLTWHRMEYPPLPEVLGASRDGAGLHVQLMLGGPDGRSITVESEDALQTRLAQLARAGWELRSVSEVPAPRDGDPARVTMVFEVPSD